MKTPTVVPSSFFCPPALCGRLLALLFALVFGAEARAQSAPPTGGTVDSIGLADAVEQTLRTYPAIEAARRGVDAATARVGRARSGYWPRVSAVGTYRRQDPVSEVTVPGGGAGGGGERSIAIQPNNLYDGHLQVRQTLYDFGRTGARVDQAEAGRTAARRQVDVERAELAFQVVQTFYVTHLAEARVDVQREQIDQLERTLAVVQRQKEAGTATEFEVQSTRTRLTAARSQLTQFRSQRQRQAAELRRLLGSAPGTTPSRRLSGTLEPILTVGDTARIDADSLARQALLQHPSVRVAQAQVEAARRQVRVADKSDAPTLSLDAQGGVKNGYPGDLNEPRLNESIGLSLTVPLFDGFATEREEEEAQAQVQAAEARLTDVRRQVSTRVEQAASDLRTRLDRLASTQQRVEQARTAAQLARTRYEAGTITNLELLEAETALQEARLERTEVRYQVVLGRYALQRAVGVLLPLSAALL
jgi:TolC family type I secretion outer membrane protein